ncbi:MAG: 2-succinyl-5-enolpyruvyl-6-hydroxy-3-cyclohexene-1-carboxylate synthase [Saprospiraceae bacterium]|jgi:2-succinyl-5-enolpyruvyl-6-hydroxy-3-cyclohexene-1-carboxylate synthase
MNYSNKIAVRNLVETCVAKDVTHVVISPGSRNAPLIITFNRHPSIKTTVIVDERSAAFYALGIAQQTKKTVAIVCTSGTAALNYSPAIAEAYYQKIPLLVITADRPAEWIDQMDGQTIRQENVYSNFIKKSFNLPTEPSTEEEIWHCNRIFSEAIESTHYPEAGPVHINFPLREPLYETKDYTGIPLPKQFSTTTTLLELPEFEISALKNKWKAYKKILIVSGLLHPNDKINEALTQIAEQNHVAVLTETTSNLFGNNFNRSIDRLLIGIEGKNVNNFQPDLLITLGGPVVSKKIKAFLRNNPPQEHWHVNASNDYIDTYKSLSKNIPVSPEKFLPAFVGIDTPGNYKDIWRELDKTLLKVFKSFMDTIEFSDLKVFDSILNSVPQSSNVQLANSTAVRYSNLFDAVANRKLNCFSNRGTSGIDGTISTAVGAAATTDKITTVISGDLSFLYDSNALWITPMPKNLRIIVINNKGGNIFRIIDGPSSTNELGEFFEAKHNLNAKHLALTFGLAYINCKNDKQLNAGLNMIFDTAYKKACVLEIETDNKLTPNILKTYFKGLKKRV